MAGAQPAQAQDHGLEAARFDLAVTGTGSAVLIKGQLKIDVVLIARNSMFRRKFFQTAKSSDEQQVVLETGGAAAGNSHFRHSDLITCR